VEGVAESEETGFLGDAVGVEEAACCEGGLWECWGKWCGFGG